MAVKQVKSRSVSRTQFVKDTLGTLFTKFILIFLKVGVSVVTARMLGPAGRGAFYSSVQTSGLANTIGTMSVGEGIIYHIGKGDLQRKSILGTVLFLVIAFTAILWSILYLVFPYLSEHLLHELSPETLSLIFIMMPFMMFEYIASSALRGMKLFTTTNKLTIITRVNILLLLAATLLLYSPSIYYGLLAYTCALGINAILYMGALYGASDRHFGVELRGLPLVLKYGGKVHPGTLLTEVEYRLDVFILLYFIDVAAVGVYSIGVTVAQILWYISNSINSVLFPHLTSAGDYEDKDLFAAKVIKYNLLINFFVILFLVLFGLFIIQILYGEEFSDSYYVFLILTPGLLFDSVARNLSAWLKSVGRPAVLSYVSMVSLSVNIAMNFLLIPMYGLYGAAYASVISYVVRAIILFVIFKRSISATYMDIFVLDKAELFKVYSVFISVVRPLMKRLKP